MELKDEVVIHAPREEVYAALNDTDVLKDCIPGCEELTRTGENDLAAKVTLKIGPVKARFSGEVTLDPQDPPERFSLSGQGNGGVAGFAKGGATVTLEAVPQGTRLVYEAKADVGGKIAQLGGRLIQSTAKKLAGQFFNSFAQKLNERGAASETSVA